MDLSSCVCNHDTGGTPEIVDLFEIQKEYGEMASHRLNRWGASLSLQRLAYAGTKSMSSPEGVDIRILQLDHWHETREWTSSKTPSLSHAIRKLRRRCEWKCHKR